MPTSDSTSSSAPRLLAAAGPQAVERLLLDQIDALLPHTGLDPRQLARPVVVVVPSRALRLHVASALARHRGRALAGLTVRTHRTLASQILERAGERAPEGDSLFEVLVARAARAEPALRQALDPFGDGYAAAALTVRDLLDAGFTGDLADVLLEQLEPPALGISDGRQLAASLREWERARALVRVAAQVHADMERQGLGRVSTLLARAAELLVQQGEEALPTRAVIVHGFAAGVGLVIDFLHAVLRLPGAVLLADRPPDPLDRSRADEGNAFSEPFLERLVPGASSRATQSSAPRGGLGAPRRTFFQAAGAHAEVREVARRIRELLDAGTEPEAIGVVARSLDPYRLPARLHFGRLGIPFSGIGATGPATRLHRRAAALLDLLQQGERVPTDRWLDCLQLEGARGSTVAAWAAGHKLGALPPEFDLRLALRALGTLRLHDVAQLDVGPWLDGSGRYRLPVRRGLEDEAPIVSDAGEAAESTTTRAPRRTIEGTTLRALAAAAQRLCARLRSAATEAPAREHLQQLRQLLAEDLCWGEHDPDAAAWETELAAIAETVQAEFVLERTEWVGLVRAAFEDLGRPPVGGHGGGVRLLSVTEARSCTFDHLFVLGVDRGAFPRVVRRDPLLPDPLRRALQVTLPDLPLKEAGFDEERYLFAQLLEAAPQVTVSWLATDDDGKERGPSPLIWRALGATPWADVPLALPWTHSQPGVLRTAYEAAVASGLDRGGHHRREPWEIMAQVAIEEAARELGDAAAPIDAAELARARWSILHEFNRAPQTSARGELDVGPWFGFIGPRRARGDPRNNPLFVSTMEDLARCPWRTFLRRVLRVTPLVDPLSALPALDGRLRGDALHGVLQRIVRAALPDPEGLAPSTVEQARARGPLRVAWPPPATLEQWIGEECERAVRDAGVALPGLTALLRVQLRPMLAVARLLEWGDGGVLEGVLGPEVESAIDLEPLIGPEAAAQQLRFRADRVDLQGGALRLTDYKSGRPLTDVKTEARRATKLLEAIASGANLQAAVYAASGAATTVGRYVYLTADSDPAERVFEVAGSDPDARAALGDALQRLLRGWQQGALFPRLIQPDGRRAPRLCELCEVKQACVRGDSGLRDRLQVWVQHALKQRAGGQGTGSPSEDALLDVWTLGGADADDQADRAADAGATP